MRLDGTINYGHLLTAGTILVGLIIWGTNSANDAKQAREETVGLRGDIASLRTEFASGQKEWGVKIDSIQTQLGQKFPAYDTDLKNLFDRAGRTEAAVERHSDEMDKLDRRTWTLERFMESVQQASKGTLSPPSPIPAGPSPRR